MVKKALKEAFPKTIPVLLGFLFLSMSYGFLMRAEGYSLRLAAALCIFVYAGSLQFVAVDLLKGPFDPISIFTLTLMVNARHLFYGVATLDKIRDMGLKKAPTIFGLTDETFAIINTVEPKEGGDRGWFYFFISALNYTYWLVGTIIGYLVGGLVNFNTQGLDFVLTALFFVMFVETWQVQSNRLPAVFGLGVSILSVFIFGPQSFIIPAMLMIILGFAIQYKRGRL